MVRKRKVDSQTNQDKHAQHFTVNQLKRKTFTSAECSRERVGENVRAQISKASEIFREIDAVKLKSGSEVCQ